MRGYVNEKHQLTGWGDLLSKILKKLDSTPDQAEAALLAVELLRLGLLTSDALFSKDFGGGAVHGTGSFARLGTIPPQMLTLRRYRSKKLSVRVEIGLYRKDVAPSERVQWPFESAYSRISRSCYRIKAMPPRPIGNESCRDVPGS